MYPSSAAFAICAKSRLDIQSRREIAQYAVRAMLVYVEPVLKSAVGSIRKFAD